MSPSVWEEQSFKDDGLAPGYGQPIEYIQDRLYLASYNEPPTQPSGRNRVGKRGARSAAASAVFGPSRKQPVYFSVDDTLVYNAFHADFGPFHIGHLYRFAVQFHEILGDPENADRAVVFWSYPCARARANAACLVACYMVLIQSWPPHLALAPIAQADPPYMPFRDAGYSQADYLLSIQDVVYGVWKAKEEGLCELKDFSLEEYETFERVDMGDFNWVTPHFLAFASPQHQPVKPTPVGTPEYAALPSTVSQVHSSNLPTPFKNVLSHFSTRDIGLVVRLNSELYDPSYFTALGIQHLDMIFDDGTCPTLPMVRRFIKLAHDMIAKGKGIAVHCKAGLGRTGCLMGAYLIYRYGFIANEVISFMRFMRPGMVVGPQQHWLHLNQGTFREWWYEDSMKEKLMLQLASPVTPTRNFKQRLVVTPPNAINSHTGASSSHRRAVFNEIGNNEASNSPSHDENLPAPTPGQPRKSHRKEPRHPYSRAPSGSFTTEEFGSSTKRHISSTDRGSSTFSVRNDSRNATQLAEQSESEEELQLQLLAQQNQARILRTRSTTNTTPTVNTIPTSSPPRPVPWHRSTMSTISPSATSPIRHHHTGSSNAPSVNIHEDVAETWIEASGTSKQEPASHNTTNRHDLVRSHAVHGRPISTKTSASGGNGVLGVSKTRTSPRRNGAIDSGASANGPSNTTDTSTAGGGSGAPTNHDTRIYRTDGKAVRKISGRVGNAGLSGSRVK